MKKFALIALLALASSLAQAQGTGPRFNVSPPEPTEVDEITLDVANYGAACIEGSTNVSVGMSANVITITWLNTSPDCQNGIATTPSPICPPCTNTHRLGPLPAGTYTARVRSAQGVTLFEQQLVVKTASEAGVAPRIDYGDSYWLATESGWALHLINTQSRLLAGVLAVFDQNNNPVWYFLAPGRWINEQRTDGVQRYEMTVQKVRASYFGSPTFSEVGRQDVGTMMLEFRRYDASVRQVRMTYTIEGVTKSAELQRQRF